MYDIIKKMKLVKMESSDDAIKRGVNIQTTFMKECKIKRNKDGDVRKKIYVESAHDREHREFTRKMKMINM